MLLVKQPCRNNYELVVMYVRRFDSNSRHLGFLLLIVGIITNVNSQLGNKTFYYLLHNAPIIEILNEPENVFYKIVVSRFEVLLPPSQIEKRFILCMRKGVVIGMREILGLIREGVDHRWEPGGALVTDCAVACEMASGFFPAVGVAVISSGCAATATAESAQSDENSVDETIVRMKASWLSLVKPLNLFLNHFQWKTIAIISSHKASLKIAADFVGGSLRSNGITVNFYEVDQESDIIRASAVVTDQKMTSVLNAAGKVNNILVVFLTPEDHVILLKVANKLEMLNGLYAILTTNDIEDSSPDASVEKAKTTLQEGLIIMNYWINRTEFKEKSSIDFGYFRDAAMTLFQGVNSATGKDSNYTTILKKMRQVNFTGVTGLVVFTPNGERKMAYAFINVRNGRSVEVLYYMDDDDYKWKGEGIIWPGGTTDAPSDTPQDTSMSNVVKISLIVLGFLGGCCVALLIFYIIYRQLRYQTLLKATKTWIIPWSDLRFHANLHGRNRSLISVSRASHATSHASSDSRTSLVDFSRTDEKYFIATYKNSEIIAQRLNCASIDLTDRNILNEIYQSLSLSHENIVRYIGICPFQPNVAIVMTVAHRGSLQDLLMSSDRVVFTLDFMASLLLDAAKGMAYLHSTDLGSHGHLTSSKCVVDSKWTCQISGCGFRRMKKTIKRLRHFDQHEELYFKGLLWTAPELLRMSERQRPIYGTKEGDVYSFAIILQEVILMKSPYPEESTQYYYRDIIGQIQKVSATPFRPALVEADCSEEWIDLIERCWIESPNKRPTFSKIIQDLESLSETQEQTPTGLMEKLMVRTEKHAMNLAGQVKQATAEVELERKRVYNLLHALLPRYVADRLEKGEGVSAESFESCTMYYADIVGFTKLAASSSPMQVVELLNSLYSKYDEITDAHDTYKVETIGDCYVVASGLPIPNGKKHVTEIANLALDVLAYIKSFNIPHMKGAYLQTRIGIHSGPVLAGIVGVKTPRYTVFGETTAIAERMEALGVANMIHITRMTADILRETKLYVLEKRGEMEVTREHVLTTYFLLGLIESVETKANDDKSKKKRKSSTPSSSDAPVAPSSRRKSKPTIIGGHDSPRRSSMKHPSENKARKSIASKEAAAEAAAANMADQSAANAKVKDETKTEARPSATDEGLKTDSALRPSIPKTDGKVVPRRRSSVVNKERQKAPSERPSTMIQERKKKRSSAGNREEMKTEMKRISAKKPSIEN